MPLPLHPGRYAKHLAALYAVHKLLQNSGGLMVRRAVVAPAGSSWWGIDPSTRRLALGWKTPAGQRGVRTVSFRTDLRDGARLWHVYEQSFALMQVVHAEAPAGHVLIEQPFGKNVPPVSYLVMGVMMTAAHRVTGALVEPVPVPTWKLNSVGRGDAKKPEVMRWAQSVGYGDALQDEADAYGLAEAGSRLVMFKSLVEGRASV